MTPDAAAKTIACCAYRYRDPHADSHAKDEIRPGLWIAIKRWGSVAKRAPSTNNSSGYSFEDNKLVKTTVQSNKFYRIS